MTKNYSLLYAFVFVCALGSASNAKAGDDATAPSTTVRFGAYAKTATPALLSGVIATMLAEVACNKLGATNSWTRTLSAPVASAALSALVAYKFDTDSGFDLSIESVDYDHLKYFGTLIAGSLTPWAANKWEKHHFLNQLIAQLGTLNLSNFTQKLPSVADYFTKK